MIICTHCAKEVEKNTFCSDKCRVYHNRDLKAGKLKDPFDVIHRKVISKEQINPETFEVKKSWEDIKKNVSFL